MAEAIKMEIKGLTELKLAFKKSPQVVMTQIQRAISLSIAVVGRQSKIEAPVKTGRLRAGIRSRIVPFRGIVESTVAYGIFIHEGTSAHIIRPVKKKALYWKGAKHPVKSVRHPGTRANPFMQRGADKSELKVRSLFQNAINNVTKKLSL